MAYKLQKAWQRNKLIITAGAVVAVALVAGVGISTWQAVIATKGQVLPLVRRPVPRLSSCAPMPRR